MRSSLDINKKFGFHSSSQSVKFALICLLTSFTLSTSSQTFENNDEELEPSLDTSSNVEDTLETNEANLEDTDIDIPVDNIPEDPGSFETFIPSEDISEDYSVPFPVDI